MNILKQSTAATIKLGAFVDDTDGKTAKTGLTISQADIRLSKNGGDFAQTNNATGATHDEFGYYDIPLDATDTNTLGRLRVAVSVSGALPVWQDFLVVTANVYDTLCSTDKLEVELATGHGLATATALQTVDDNVDAILVDTGTTLDTIDKKVSAFIDPTGYQVTGTGVGDGALNGIYKQSDTYTYDLSAGLWLFRLERESGIWKIYSPGPDGADAIFYTATNNAETPDLVDNWELGQHGELPLPEIGFVSAVRLAGEQGRTTWKQVKIVDDVEENGALVIQNNGENGAGISTFGKFAGMVNCGDEYGQLNMSEEGSTPVSGYDPAIVTAIEALVNAIKGAGWTNETLKAIMEAIGDIDGGGGGLDAEGVRDAIGLAAANLDTQLSGIHSKTTNLPASPAATGDAMTLTAAYDNAKDDVLTPLATVDTVVDGIATTLANPDNFKADVSALALESTLTAMKGAGWTNESLVTLKAYVDEIETRLTATRAGYLDKLNVTGTLAHSDAAAAYKADVSGLAPANEYDAQLSAIQADLDNPDQYKADVSALAKATDLQDVENKVDLIDVTTVANGGKIDAVDTKVSAIDTDTIMSFMIDGFTFEQIVQIMASVLAGKLTRSGDTLTFRDLADTVNRVVAETDENKQRTGITYTV